MSKLRLTLKAVIAEISSVAVYSRLSELFISILLPSLKRKSTSRFKS